MRLTLVDGRLQGHADSLSFDLTCARSGGVGSEGEQEVLSLLMTLPPIDFQVDMLTLHLPQGRVQGAAKLRHLAQRIELEWLTGPGELRLLLEPWGDGWRWSGDVPAGALHPLLPKVVAVSGEWLPGQPLALRASGGLPSPVEGDWQLAVQAVSGPQGWQILPGSSLTVPRLRWQDADIRELRITPRRALSTREALELQLDWAQASWKQTRLPVQAVLLDMAGLDDHQGQIRARLGHELSLLGHWRYRPQGLALTVAEQTLSLPEAWAWLAGWLAVPAGFELETGELTFSLNAADLLNPKLPIRLSMSVADSDFSYRGVMAEGASGHLDLSWSQTGWRSQGTNSLSIARIHPGVEVSDIYAAFRLERGQPWLSGLTARLLGGQLAVSPMALGSEFSGELHLSDISLALVLTQVAVTGLSGDGRLHGRLPFSYRQGISVSNGRMYSRDGWLSYQAEAELLVSAEDNLSLALTLGMLKDLRYERLDASISMMPTGEAVIDSRLVGHAPVMGQDHPVNLNYHHEENLLQLLTSLRFAHDISESLPSRLQGEKK
ncbi:hypothetical protein GCM10022394_34480 [Zobellella aerophila]|uniref:Dicarboxylate transport domain-containing protein n=1 Tax=Zobellella aerophila TaxID=870480 RepID=A0ABP6WMR3_9GAMM